MRYSLFKRLLKSRTHIDLHQTEPVPRQPYPPRRVVEKAHVVLPYDDLMDTPTRSITYAVEGERLPPHPERDLLWFLITYAPLETWQHDVLQIIREESYYFHPQFHTKIMNEGWASYWHAELFHLYNGRVAGGNDRVCAVTRRGG